MSFNTMTHKNNFVVSLILRELTFILPLHSVAINQNALSHAYLDTGFTKLSHISVEFCSLAPYNKNANSLTVKRLIQITLSPTV